MVVLTAAGIEGCRAFRTGIATLLVFVDGEFCAAYPAKNCLGVKLCFWPDFWLMASIFFVAGKAGIILVATLEFDGDHVQIRMPVLATGLVIDRFAVDIDAFDAGFHDRQSYVLLGENLV